MPQTHSIDTPLAVMRPKHHLDTKLWCAWPDKPDVVVKHGKILLKWTVVDTTVVDNYFSFMARPSSVANAPIPTKPAKKVTKWFSEDGGRTWHEDNFTASYKWKSSKKSVGQEKILDDEISFGKETWYKARNREKAAEKNKLLKEKAQKLGITVAELRQQQAKEKENKNPHKVSKLDIERTKRKIAIGPILKDLQDEASKVMEKLNDTNSKLRIVHVDRYKRKLAEAVRILQQWQE